jgi:ssDNA-binding Zn-finger/Zn-ribbon topoisomerase 1
MTRIEEWRRKWFIWHLCITYPQCTHTKNVVCYCGEMFRAHPWQATQEAGTLPQGHHICPTCFAAWNLKRKKVLVTLDNGETVEAEPLVFVGMKKDNVVF